MHAAAACIYNISVAMVSRSNVIGRTWCRPIIVLSSRSLRLPVDRAVLTGVESTHSLRPSPMALRR